jgi:hypothetical protein
LVQDGILVTVDADQLSEALDYVRAALMVVCQSNDQPPNCWEDQLPIVDGSLQITLPEAAGDFAGQTAFISVTNSTVTVDINGGLWLVSGFWTWSGLDNDLAIYRNLLIAICWVFACVAVGILIPPFRTARKAIVRALLPMIISEVATANSMQVYSAKKKKLVHLANTISGGAAAMMTIFEPRIFTAPMEYIVPQLKTLMVAIEQAVLQSLLLVAWNEEDPSAETTRIIKETSTVLNLCAKSLASNEPEAEESLRRIKAEMIHEMRDPVLEGPSKHVSHRIEDVLDATLAWLDAFNHPKKHSLCSKEGLQNLAKNYVPWVLVPLIPFKRMAVIPTLPFHPKNWDWRAIIWSLEFTLGFVALFSATVYWDKYSDFAIETNRGTGSASFSGWQLLGYAYGSKPTYEGTLKKGSQRAFGTVCGGFLGWLAIIVCSWSYDDDAEINLYGLTVWLSVSCLIVAYFSVDPGPAAIMGAGYDHGIAGLYFLMTEVLVALEVYTGSGDKNPILVNRIVATVAGVAMAMLVAATPPFVKGGDPKHAVACWTSMKEDFLDLLRTLLEEDDCSRIVGEDYTTVFLQDAMAKRALAMFFVKDAARFKILPFCRVDERLEPLVEDLFISESLIRGLLLVAGDIVAEDKVAALREGREGSVLKKILSSYSDAVTTSSENEKGPWFRMESVGEESVENRKMSLFLSMADTISRKLRRENTALGNIRST